MRIETSADACQSRQRTASGGHDGVQFGVVARSVWCVGASRTRGFAEGRSEGIASQAELAAFNHHVVK